MPSWGRAGEWKGGQTDTQKQRHSRGQCRPPSEAGKQEDKGPRPRPLVTPRGGHSGTHMSHRPPGSFLRRLPCRGALGRGLGSRAGLPPPLAGSWATHRVRGCAHMCPGALGHSCVWCICLGIPAAFPCSPSSPHPRPTFRLQAAGAVSRPCPLLHPTPPTPGMPPHVTPTLRTTGEPPL